MRPRLLAGLLGVNTTTLASPPAAVPITNKVIFTPSENFTDPRVLYARTVELSDGTLLATWENYTPEPPLVYFPIYQSKNRGQTWNEISQVHDQANNWGLRFQPFLYELPREFAGFPKGTVLLSGNSVPTNLTKTRIDVYASTDAGVTWKFLSKVVEGGEALPVNGQTPMWEPFLLLDDASDSLIVFYSDQSDPAHAQKLVHKTTKDLLTWDVAVDDVAYQEYTARPGMTTVTQLPNNKFLMTYEYGGGPGFVKYDFPAYYRISDSPLTFNAALHHPLGAMNKAGEKITPVSSPYVTWSSVGGVNGTIIVSLGTHKSIFVNRALGDESMWKAYDVPENVSYSRHLRVLKSDANSLLIMGAGNLPPCKGNKVTVTMVDLAETIGL